MILGHLTASSPLLFFICSHSTYSWLPTSLSRPMQLPLFFTLLYLVSYHCLFSSPFLYQVSSNCLFSSLFPLSHHIPLPLLFPLLYSFPSYSPFSFYIQFHPTPTVYSAFLYQIPSHFIFSQPLLLYVILFHYPPHLCLILPRCFFCLPFLFYPILLLIFFPPPLSS